MHPQSVLSCVWGVWFSHSSGSKTDVTYGSSLTFLGRLENWGEFAYIWKESLVGQPSNFFADPASGRYTKYEIGGLEKKIESINLFKYPIEPTWEYGDNESGGYYNFSLGKEAASEEVQKVYEALVFLALGNCVGLCEDLRGIRIVDTSAKNRFRCRFEIWMTYREDDENLEKIKAHAGELQKAFQLSNLTVQNMKFFNIAHKSALNSQPNSQHPQQST